VRLKTFQTVQQPNFDMRKSLTRSRAAIHFVTFGLWVLACARAFAADLEWVERMIAAHARFKGKPGYVAQLGDSITYSMAFWSPLGWDSPEKYLTRDDGLPKVPADKRWRDILSGFRDKGPKHGNYSGWRVGDVLKVIDQVLAEEQPEIALIMLGTNDISGGRVPPDYSAGLKRIIQKCLEAGCVPILNTIPPRRGHDAAVDEANRVVRGLASDNKIPLADFHAECIRLAPGGKWDGTVISNDGVHPSGGNNQVYTDENMSKCGYAIRNWVNFLAVREVYFRVLHPITKGTHKAEAPPSPEPTTKPTAGIRIPITRDTWFSGVGKEGDGNNGGSQRLKFKSIQEFPVMDFDPAPLRGKTVRRAFLHVRATENSRLQRITLSTFGADWVEGTGSSYAVQTGSSTFNHRKHPDVPWTFLGSTVNWVMLGEGGTFWRMSDASPPDADGWQVIPVERSIIAARVAGMSYGLLVFDDTGTERPKPTEKETFARFPNRYIYSREAGKDRAPYLTVELGESDAVAPDAPSGFKSATTHGNPTAPLPTGEAILTWITPADSGPAGTLGFNVEIHGTAVPRHLIPIAKAPGSEVTMRVRDLALDVNREHTIAIRAVDGAGNESAPITDKFRVSQGTAITLGVAPFPASSAGAPLPKLGNAEIAIVDSLDKVHPTNGVMIPSQDATYLSRNHLWDASAKKIQLHAARNEIISFQVLVRGQATGFEPRLSFDDLPGATVSWGRYHHVPVKNEDIGSIAETMGKGVKVERVEGVLPDPVLPLNGKFSVPDPSEAIAGQNSGSLLCEIYVPNAAPVGTCSGELVLTTGTASLRLKVELEVWDFTLPNRLSFIPEMNCYGLPSGNEMAFYRLAHRHRTVLDAVGYSQRGTVSDGWAPKVTGTGFDWTDWDARFGPLFDGSAFRDLPRKGAPVEVFMLPVHENWPVPIAKHYNGDYWADRAFTPEYRDGLVRASRRFAAHFAERGWKVTGFQFFLNNKAYAGADPAGYRRSSPWQLDEPVNFQDFWALRWYGRAFHEGFDPLLDRVHCSFRCDISRSQWQRDALDGVMNYNVASGAMMREFQRMVVDRAESLGQFLTTYGGSNPVEANNTYNAAWCIDAWTLGANGVIPWQTVGRDSSWKQGETTCVLYPGGPAGSKEPIPSIRLKAYLRGQEDVEYLTLLQHSTGWPRAEISRQVRSLLRLQHVPSAAGWSDPRDDGRHFGALKPGELWALRVGIGRMISQKSPPPAASLVEWKIPPFDARHSSPGHVTGTGP
jgi:lysophospholipase L1-like esterase